MPVVMLPPADGGIVGVDCNGIGDAVVVVSVGVVKLPMDDVASLAIGAVVLASGGGVGERDVAAAATACMFDVVD